MKGNEIENIKKKGSKMKTTIKRKEQSYLIVELEPP